MTDKSGTPAPSKNYKRSFLMKEDEAPLFAHHTASKGKFQEESIKAQIAQQNAIIQNAQRIIEKATTEIEKAKSDQLIAENAKHYFSQQLETPSLAANKSIEEFSEKDNTRKSILEVLEKRSSEEGMEAIDISNELPELSRGTVFRTLNILVKERKIRQLNPDSKKHRRFGIYGKEFAA